MDVREKLVELLDDIQVRGEDFTDYEIYGMRVPDTVSNENVASHLIAHGVTVQEWISVSEPPKERGCYLVSVKHWLDGKPVTREAKWNGADWLSCYKAEEITPRVTHWTYLPQPPKGE